MTLCSPLGDVQLKQCFPVSGKRDALHAKEALLQEWDECRLNCASLLLRRSRLQCSVPGNSQLSPSSFLSSACQSFQFRWNTKNCQAKPNLSIHCFFQPVCPKVVCFSPVSQKVLLPYSSFPFALLRGRAGREMVWTSPEPCTSTW